MAGLLRTFHPVPPVVRRRAKELLDVVRDCVKVHLSSNTASPTPVFETEKSVLINDMGLSEAVRNTSQGIESESSTLWAFG